MANTSDSIGVQETLDKLIANELSNFEDDTVTKLRQYAFYYRTALVSVVIGNCADVSVSSFEGCRNLELIDFSKEILIPNSPFNGCIKLKHLILRSENFCKLLGSFANVFSGTEIRSGSGAIYVPSSLVDTYKAATNWSAGADYIHPLEDYPIP